MQFIICICYVQNFNSWNLLSSITFIFGQGHVGVWSNNCADRLASMVSMAGGTAIDGWYYSRIRLDRSFERSVFIFQQLWVKCGALDMNAKLTVWKFWPINTGAKQSVAMCWRTYSRRDSSTYGLVPHEIIIFCWQSCNQNINPSIPYNSSVPNSYKCLVNQILDCKHHGQRLK